MSSARPPWALLAWFAVAGALILTAQAPPPIPAVTAEEEAVFERSAQKAGQDARTWNAERGDLALEWNEASGHLAILVDDVGRELHLFEQLLGLRHRLSFSVVPGGVYGAGVQLRARSDSRRPREIWLHLPMEPTDADKMRQGPEARETFLLTTDSPAVLQEKTRAALAAVPAAVGVNNHMGSRLSADRDAMEAVMEVLAGADVAFVDSRTTADTVAADVARERGLAAASRSFFLDDDPSAEAIQEALDAAVEAAKSAPTIAIIHPSAQAVRILRTTLARAHARGVAIFPVSEVIAHQLPRPAASLP